MEYHSTVFQSPKYSNSSICQQEWWTPNLVRTRILWPHICGYVGRYWHLFNFTSTLLPECESDKVKIWLSERKVEISMAALHLIFSMLLSHIIQLKTYVCIIWDYMCYITSFQIFILNTLPSALYENQNNNDEDDDCIRPCTSGAHECRDLFVHKYTTGIRARRRKWTSAPHCCSQYGAYISSSILVPDYLKVHDSHAHTVFDVPQSSVACLYRARVQWPVFSKRKSRKFSLT